MGFAKKKLNLPVSCRHILQIMFCKNKIASAPEGCEHYNPLGWGPETEQIQKLK